MKGLGFNMDPRRVGSLLRNLGVMGPTAIGGDHLDHVKQVVGAIGECCGESLPLVDLDLGRRVGKAADVSVALANSKVVVCYVRCDIRLNGDVTPVEDVADGLLQFVVDSLEIGPFDGFTVVEPLSKENAELRVGERVLIRASLPVLGPSVLRVIDLQLLPELARCIRKEGTRRPRVELVTMTVADDLLVVDLDEGVGTLLLGEDVLDSGNGCNLQLVGDDVQDNRRLPLAVVRDVWIPCLNLLGPGAVLLAGGPIGEVRVPEDTANAGLDDALGAIVDYE